MRTFACIACCVALAACAQTQGPKKASKKVAGNPAFYVARSNLNAYQGHFAESIVDINQALQAQPHSAYLHFTVADRYAQARQWEPAMEHVEKALKERPDWTEPLLLKADLFAVAGMHDKAAPIYADLLKKNPEKEEVAFKLAQSFVEGKKYQEAIRILEKQVALNPDSVNAYVLMGAIQNNHLKKTTEAIRSYRKGLQLEPDNIRIRYQLAQMFIASGKINEALEQCLVIEKEAPADVGIQIQVATLYFDSGKIDEAIRRLEGIAKAHPEADRVQFYLGVILEKVKKPDVALGYYSRLGPKSLLYKDARIHSAMILREQKKYAEGITLLQEAIQKLPKTPEFYQVLALLFEESGSLGDAVQVLKTGVGKNPNIEGLHFNLGALLDKQKERAGALLHMEKVLEINPDNPSALNYIGYTLAERGEKLPEAKRMIEKAIRLKPEDPYILDSLGWVYYQMGEYTKAETYIRSALKKMPNEPVLLEHMGDVLQKLSRPKEALIEYKRALQYAEKKPNGNEEVFPRVSEKIGILSK